MGPEVGRIWVDVDAAVVWRLWFPSRHPFSIDVLPAVAISWGKVQQERIHGVWVQARHADLQNREHPSGQETKKKKRHHWKLVLKDC